MKEAPHTALLPDGRRLHLRQGPIDLLVEAVGNPAAVRAAYAAAERRFAPLLGELCAELTLLRSPAGRKSPRPEGVVAQRMLAAVQPFAVEGFITPMAAVAGAVAEEILAAMTAAGELSRASVNNGGDIALHLAPGEVVTLGLVDRPDRPRLFGRARIAAGDRTRGIATSGWLGRSFSLGIAEAVTVLAPTAALADAAATVIANAVDLPGHPGVRRVPACEIQPDNDLGPRLVTRAVAPLTGAEIRGALAGGLACARRLIDDDLIDAAALHLQGETLLATRHASPFALLEGTLHA